MRKYVVSGLASLLMTVLTFGLLAFSVLHSAPQLQGASAPAATISAAG